MTAIRQMPYDDGRADQGERQALELADRLRMLAASEPDLAQDLVEQLIESLNEATSGAFDEHIKRQLANTGANPSGSGHSPAGNS
jgi:tRNA splicing ligase